jgi:hypothetical protein
MYICDDWYVLYVSVDCHLACPPYVLRLHAHSRNIMFVAFLRHHWLRERGLMLRYTLSNLIESIPLCSKIGFAIGKTRKHLGLKLLRPTVRRLCFCFPPSSTGAALSWESPEPLVLKRTPQSPLLARKESFGREMADLILPYRFDFHVIVRGF